MTEENKELNLAELKEQAIALNIEFPNNITAATLAKKIKEFTIANAKSEVESVELSRKEKIAKIRRECKRKVRIKLVCMNPDKKDWRGEIITTGNNFTGDIKEFVPFNKPNGWHVYQSTLDFLLEREFQTFVTERSRDGVEVRKGVLQREFAIEVLKPLTKEEIEAQSN